MFSTFFKLPAIDRILRVGALAVLLSGLALSLLVFPVTKVQAGCPWIDPTCTFVTDKAATVHAVCVDGI